MSLISQAVQIIHARDPKEAILEEVEEFLDGITVGGSDLLVAVYRRGDAEGRTKGGIILSDRTKDEDDYQGVTGLVLKTGPFAYNTQKSSGWFAGREPKPGDWVHFDIKYSHHFKLGRRSVRVIQDTYILAVIDRPDMFA